MSNTTSLREIRLSASLPAYRPVAIPAKRTGKAKAYFMDTLFAGFCALSGIGAWRIAELFANDSYKAVTLFLGIIFIANVAGKYLVWTIQRPA